MPFALKVRKTRSWCMGRAQFSVPNSKGALRVTWKPQSCLNLGKDSCPYSDGLRPPFIRPALAEAATINEAKFRSGSTGDDGPAAARLCRVGARSGTYSAIESLVRKLSSCVGFYSPLDQTSRQIARRRFGNGIGRHPKIDRGLCAKD